MKSFVTRTFGAALLGIMGGAAWAVPISLTYTDPVSVQIQQNANNPMIIGHSGQNGTFAYTDDSPAQNPNPQDFISPNYTVQQIRDLLALTTPTNAFSVQIDINETNEHQNFYYFSMSVNGDEKYVFDPAGGGPTLGSALLIPPANSNGNGYSDASLSLFSVAGYAATDIVTFHAIWENNDGFETFFIHAEPDDVVIDPHSIVPEPATLALVGLGLTTMGAIRRRRRA